MSNKKNIYGTYKQIFKTIEQIALHLKRLKKNFILYFHRKNKEHSNWHWSSNSIKYLME